MRNFIYLELLDARFQMIKKSDSPEKKEIKQIAIQMRQLQNQLDISTNPQEKLELKDELAELKEDEDLNKEIDKLEQGSKRGPQPYLKMTHPIYSFHAYEEPGNTKSKEVKGDEGLW